MYIVLFMSKSTKRTTTAAADFNHRLESVSCSSPLVAVSCHVGNVLPALQEHVQRAPMIVGCIAWLTHPDVLSALSDKKVSIIVQKEKYLQGGGRKYMKKWASGLKDKYDKLRGWTANEWNTLVSPFEPVKRRVASVRGIGWNRKSGALNTPLMHHKFLVFCDKDGKPYGVWTGSFNLTKNSTKSRENASYFQSTSLAKFYYEEWKLMAQLSETVSSRTGTLSKSPKHEI